MAARITIFSQLQSVSSNFRLYPYCTRPLYAHETPPGLGYESPSLPVSVRFLPTALAYTVHQSDITKRELLLSIRPSNCSSYRLDTMRRDFD